MIVLLAFLLVITTLPINAQNLTGKVYGLVVDTNNKGIPFVSVNILDTSSKVVFSAQTDSSGKFIIDHIPAQNYLVQFKHLSYQSIETHIQIKRDQNTIHLADIILRPQEIKLNEIKVKEKRALIKLKRDTIEYNVKGIQVSASDNLNALIGKLPGLNIDQNGQITFQGKVITKLLIEGKEYFGKNTQAATENLPADIVDKLQIINSQSEESKNKGIDDGNREKIVNIKLKKEKLNKWFGTASALGGTKDKYLGQLGANNFNTKRLFSILFLTNNVNATNFSQSELSTFSGGDVSSLTSPDLMGSGTGQSNSSDSPFNGISNGLIKNTSLGVNYTDAFGKNGAFKINSNWISVFSSNYLQEQNTLINPSDLGSLITGKSNVSHNSNNNSRFGTKINYAPDSLTSITSNTFLLTNSKQNILNSDYINSYASENQTIGSGEQSFNQKFNAYAFSQDFAVNHSFKNKSILSYELTLNAVKNPVSYINGNNYRYSSNQSQIDSVSGQQVRDDGNSHSSLNQLNYLRPLNKSGSLGLLLEQEFRSNIKKSNQITYAYNPLTKQTEILLADGSASAASKENTPVTSYGLIKTGKNYSINVAVHQTIANQETEVNGIVESTVNKNKLLFLPDIKYNLFTESGKNLSLNINQSIRFPNIYDLQPALVSVNPLYLKYGNPDLKYSKITSADLFYTVFNTANQSFLAINADFNYKEHDFTTTTVTDPKTGVQTITPINASSGNYDLQFGATINMPIAKTGLKLSCSLVNSVNQNQIFVDQSPITNHGLMSNLSLGLIYTTPNLTLSLNNFLSANGAFYSDKIIQDQKYLIYNTKLKTSWQLSKYLRFLDDLAYNKVYSPSSSSFNTQYIVLNSGFEQVMFPKRNVIISINGFDLLDQNRNARQKLLPNGQIESSVTNSIGRYIALKLMYRLSQK